MQRQHSAHFSDIHSVDRGEIERLASITATQSDWERSLLSVSSAHRQLAYQQFVLQQGVYWLTVFGIAIAEASSPRLAAGVIWQWLGVSFVSWLARMALFLSVYRSPPATVAKSKLLKALPLAIVVIACAYWIWSMQLLLVSPQLTARELTLFVGLLAISISMTAMWTISKVPVLVYNTVLWSALSIFLYRSGAVGALVVAMLDGLVVAILWLYVVVAIKQVGKELDRSNQMNLLNAKLREANLDLEVLKTAAYNALEGRSRFFAEASHDLRQRLHATKLMVLASRAAVRSGGDAIGVLDKLGLVVDSLNEYMNKVLDFARIESQDANVHLGPVVASSIFHKLDLHYEHIAESKGIQLLFRHSQDVIETDSALLARILDNLISNALKFARGRVLVSARRRAGGLAIEVWDDGPGIEATAHERIFEAFYQGQDERQVGGEGLGLGLAIVKRFADRLGYKVHVLSVLGKGTVFRIHVPAERLIRGV